MASNGPNTLQNRESGEEPGDGGQSPAQGDVERVLNENTRDFERRATTVVGDAMNSVPHMNASADIGMNATRLPDSPNTLRAGSSPDRDRDGYRRMSTGTTPDAGGDGEKNKDKEKEPRRTGWHPFARSQRSWLPFALSGRFFHPQPWLRRARLLGGAVGAGAAFSTFEAGSVLSQVPGIAQLGNFGTSLNASLAAVPGMPAWIPPIAGVAAPTLGLLGACYGLGRAWEWFQRTKWFRKTFGTDGKDFPEVPQRSFSKRILVGATVPFRAAGRLLQYAGQKFWKHKWPLLGGLTIGGILATGGALTPAGGLFLGGGAGVAAAAIPPKEEGGGDSGGHH